MVYNKEKVVLFTLFVFIFVLSFNVRSQEKEFEQKNPEEQYQWVRTLALNGKYTQARKYGHLILSKFPDYHDVSLMIGRTYLWENKFDSAAVYIHKVLSNQPANNEAREAELDLAYFSSDYPKVVALAPGFIQQYPDNFSYREKYAIALMALNQKEAAGLQVDTLLMKDSLNWVGNDIRKQLNPVSKKRTEINVGYSFDHFSEPYQRWWHLFTSGVTRHTQWGSLAGRMNVGHIHAGQDRETEIQAEAESYINLSKACYMMLLYGYSPGNYFPEHKASGEIWHKLPAQFIVSLGMNYYHWSNDVFIGTASLEKYTGKYWFCFRTYLHFKEIGITGSYYFTARRYWNGQDYFQVTIGSGTAPDEPFDIKTDLERLSAYSLRCMMMKKVAAKVSVRAGLGYAREEYYNELFRNRLDGTVGLIYLLGK